jgi:D-hydroxyproline dehydrogenase subunit gamma
VCPRITQNVERPSPVTILVNGNPVTAYEGESLATALIASGTLVMSRDSSGRPRSPFCNMGICFECLVTVEEAAPRSGTTVRRVRACLAAVRPGLLVTVPTQ